MDPLLLLLCLVLAAVLAALAYLGFQMARLSAGLPGVERDQERLERGMREEMAQNRREMEAMREAVDTRLARIQGDSERKLEQVRQTVEEKLTGTLDAQLGRSFRQVSDHLERVHAGLGEMRTLAEGVGDLKRVLVNVKTRGTWGEVQLGALLEQILAPEQYERNVATAGTAERVEFAVKLPGENVGGAPVWLPLDAKFPMEDYRRLVEASERGDAAGVEEAGRGLEMALRNSARQIREKYVAPPATTDFAILFLPVEGLYAETLRRGGLVDLVQREYRVVLAGPSTLAALLNSLQMGFRTLAIQQRSSEVWTLLGGVRMEFARFASELENLKRKLAQAQGAVESVERRTRVMDKRLRQVEMPAGSEAIEDAGGDEGG